jgi:polyhydroxybutyrate depolymerase
MSLQTRTIVVIGAVMLLVGGCLGGNRATADPVGGTQSLSIGGATRTFHIYRPDSLSGPAPLVVMLHGGYGDGAQAERAYHWDAQADAGHFVVAYPDGLNRAWNAGSCCGRPAQAGVDDVAFISAMVGAIEQQIPIDTTRVFVTGMSNGAMMALRLACQSNLFAAAAPVAGTQLADCSNAVPISILQIHGTADDRVPYGGGPGKMATASGVPRVDGPSVESVNAHWRSTDGCKAPVSSTSGDVTTQRADCPDGRTVELITVAGAGHQWPGGIANPVVEKIANLPSPSTALDATATIWQFFAQHHL